MRNCAISFVFIVAFFGAITHCDAEIVRDGSAFRFRVVTWNIGHFAMGNACNTAISASDSAARKAQYKAMIASLKADFLGISEYEPVFDKAGRKTETELFSGFPTRVIGPKNSYQSNAIFTRFQCAGHSVVNYTKRKQNTYFIDSVFMFGTNEVHFVQTHLDWYTPEGGELYALPQMRELVKRFQNTPYVIISADFNAWQYKYFADLINAGYVIANTGQYALLDNIAVKGFDVKTVFAADQGHNLSDHTIVGCDLEMKLPVEDMGWVDESAITTAFTGTWSRPLPYDKAIGKATVFDNVFTPFSESGGNVVTFDVTTSFLVLPHEEEVPEASLQGSLWIGTNGCFQVWTRRKGESGLFENGWVDVAADGVTPATGIDYTFRFRFDYRYGVYSVAVLDSGVMKPLVAAAGTGVNETARFPMSMKASSISSVGFPGEGRLTSILGDYAQKDYFQVMVR